MHKRLEVPNCEDCSFKANSLFCNLGEDDLKKISSHKTFNLYKKGQIIFFEGNQPQGLYCIHSGKVKVHKLGEDGKEQIVRLARQSNLLGYRALLNSEPYYATATALEDSLICYISKQAFLDLVRSNHTLSMQIIQLLTTDLKKAEQKVMNMAQKQVRDRMAEAILIIKEAYGLEKDGATICSSLTRRDVANIAGTTTETSIRILSEFNKDKIIALEGKKIKILNFDKLIKIANITD